MWEGSLSGGANAFVTGLFNVIWCVNIRSPLEQTWNCVCFRCFIGYSNANYALAEVRDPVKTLKRAAPLAMLSVTLVYMLVNVAYYAVVDKAEILGSGRIAAALYFGRLWGVGAERVCAAILPVPNHADWCSNMAAHTGCQRDRRLLDSWEHPGSALHAWSRHVVSLRPLVVSLLIDHRWGSRARAWKRRRPPVFILLC